MNELAQDNRAPAGAPRLRVVIAHDFAETFGGAERTVAELAKLYPDAPVWSILGRREVARRMHVAHRFSTLLPERETILRRYRWLAPLYPAIVRARPLPECDVLITSSYAFAHWFRTRNDAPQVCYCHSPLRFAWSMTESYGARLPGGGAASLAFRAFASGMGRLDRRAAQKVTRYVASSRYVAEQIARFYDREAEVVWPPVDCQRFRPGDEPPGDYFLVCGRLVEPYKRVEIAIDAFRALPYRLVIAGDGPAMPRLRAMASRNVEFTGALDEPDLIPLIQRCAALIFPSRDDFGLIPVEAMACGRPVIAYAGGGAMETVLPGQTGELFESQDAAALRATVARFDPGAYDAAAIRAHAEAWDVNRFATAIERIVLAAARPEKA